MISAASQLARDPDVLWRFIANTRHTLDVLARRFQYGSDSLKVFGITNELAWFDAQGNRVGEEADPTKEPPISPDDWFKKVALRFFFEGIHRQKISQVAILPAFIFGHKFQTHVSVDDPTIESEAPAVSPIAVAPSPETTEHSSEAAEAATPPRRVYVLDMTSAGFSVKDVTRIHASFKLAEAEIERRIASHPELYQEYIAKINAGLTPFILSKGADIWTMEAEVADRRYTPIPNSFVRNPMPGALTITVANKEKIVIPRADGGVWIAEPGGAFAMHENVYEKLAAATLRVLKGASVTDVFFDRDEIQPGGWRLKKEFKITIHKPGFPVRAFRRAEFPAAHRPLQQEVQAAASQRKVSLA
jgi:hypothetical protein